MKCSNCGGNYRTRELICPYCNTENALGRAWKKQRSDAELEYEKAREKAGKKVSIYVIDRIITRIMLIFILIFIIGVAGIWIFEVARGFYLESYWKNHQDEVTEELEKYYVERDFVGMDAFLEKYSLYSTENPFYAYRQACIMHRAYEEYWEYKLQFLDVSYEELIADEHDYYELRRTIEEAQDIYNVDIGIYDELDSRNQELWEEYSSEIMAFWKGTLGLTEEEIAYLTEDDYGYVDAEFVKPIVERRAYDE